MLGNKEEMIQLADGYFPMFYSIPAIHNVQVSRNGKKKERNKQNDRVHAWLLYNFHNY